MTKNVFEVARAVDLPRLTARLTGEPITAAPASPCCGTQAAMLTRDGRGCWRWKCRGCGAGGTAIDYVARLRGFDVLLSARSIVAMLGDHPDLAGEVPASLESNMAAQREAIDRIVRARRLDPDAMSYLMRGRGIEQRTVERAFDEGWLRSLPTRPGEAFAWMQKKLGMPLLLASGLVRSGSRFAAAAYRPLVFVAEGGALAEFRSLGDEQNVQAKAIQLGRHEMPILTHQGVPVTATILTGAVDVLSYIDINFDRQAVLLGTLGTGGWLDRWADMVMDRFPTVQRWHVATCSGPASERAAQTIVAFLQSKGFDAHRAVPLCGRDWNDTLLAVHG